MRFRGFLIRVMGRRNNMVLKRMFVIKEEGISCYKRYLFLNFEGLSDIVVLEKLGGWFLI